MKTIGIIGGGQLGMMLAEEIHFFGGRAICLDPNPKCPASFVCDDMVVAAYDDLEGLKALGDKTDVLTYEFENVPSSQLQYLMNTYLIPQGIQPLFDSQNRIREKNNAKKHGLKPPKFKAVHSKEDLLDGILELGYPCVYKTATFGYDGHGQVVLKSEEDVDKVEPYLTTEGILEAFIDFDFETSIIMVRSKEEIISFPMTLNRHRKGILDLCIAKEPMGIFDKIEQASKRFMESVNYKGILTIEFFVKNNEFYFNEMAPRPHNSGHYTIEGCTTNQYRELARFLLELPLEKPILNSPTIMKNILGFDVVNIKKLKPSDQVHIHMYHKDKVSPNRKMGHITFTNTTLEEYQKKYEKLFCEESYE